MSARQTDIQLYDIVPSAEKNADHQPTDPAAEQEEEEDKRLLYGIDDYPPWYLTAFLGFQHYLTMLGATVATPFILAPALCIGPDDPARAHIISTIIFVSGIVTFLQSTFGVRLPLIQGSTLSYVIASLAILKLPKWKCPSADAEADGNSTFNATSSPTLFTDNKDAIWQERICEVQGAIMVAALLEVLIGASGLAGCALRFITPLAMTPVMTLLGLALFEHAAELASQNWGIAALTIALMVVFAEYMGETQFPCCSYSRDRGCHSTRLPIFKLFPVLFSVAAVWLLCAVLTETDVLSADNPARTDTKTKLIDGAPWFRVPYPGQWGMPTVSLSGVCGMCGAVLATIITSVGNFYACARFCDAPPPPVSAVNRGILVEGLGSLMGGMWGTADGTMSYAENIGIIGVTRVASRSVFQMAAFFMVLFGLMSKFGALFVTMPEPMVGGIFFVMFSLMSSVGLGNLQFVNMEAPRNLIVIGLPLFCGLAIPTWLEKHEDAIDSGFAELDNVIKVVLSTSVFVGGVLGIFLDNTIPGSDDDRGLTKWKEQQEASSDVTAANQRCYELPFGGAKFIPECCRGLSRFVPFCPSFDSTHFSCCGKRSPGPTPAAATNGKVT